LLWAALRAKAGLALGFVRFDSPTKHASPVRAVNRTATNGRARWQGVSISY
jgi:hypothetical protein